MDPTALGVLIVTIMGACSALIVAVLRVTQRRQRTGRTDPPSEAPPPTEKKRSPSQTNEAVFQGGAGADQSGSFGIATRHDIDTVRREFDKQLADLDKRIFKLELAEDWRRKRPTPGPMRKADDE